MEDVHAKRVESLTNGVDGVLHAATLGVRAIGQGLAEAERLPSKHAIQQVDRLLSNPALSMREIFVNFDWTEFEESDQAMVVLGMQTGHGRSTPLVWKTVTRSELRDQRNEHEDALLVRLAAALPGSVRVTVVADRGFGDSKLYHFLTEEVGFDYIIRFRGVITVEAASGEKRKGSDWVGPGGRMRVLEEARVTAAPTRTGGDLRAREGDEGRVVPGHEPKRPERKQGHAGVWTAFYGRRDVPGREEPAPGPWAQTDGGEAK